MSESQGWILVALLAALIITVYLTSRRRPSEVATGAVAAELDEVIDRLGAAVQHHAEVNAVLSLVRQLGSQPELADQLGNYAREVVAAALAVYMDGLGADITATARARSDHERIHLAPSPSYQPYREKASALAQRESSLLKELQTIAQVADQQRAHNPV